MYDLLVIAIKKPGLLKYNMIRIFKLSFNWLLIVKSIFF